MTLCNNLIYQVYTNSLITKYTKYIQTVSKVRWVTNYPRDKGMECTTKFIQFSTVVWIVKVATFVFVQNNHASQKYITESINISIQLLVEYYSWNVLTLLYQNYFNIKPEGFKYSNARNNVTSLLSIKWKFQNRFLWHTQLHSDFFQTCTFL